MLLLRLIPTAPLSRLRLVVTLLIAIVLAPAIFRIWCVKGLVQTYRVDGPSMAETLCGTHFRVTCQDCGIIFRCDGDNFPDDRHAVCPNCGFRDNDLRDEDLHGGDRVLVDTWPYLWMPPRRGDLVMLVEPSANEETASTSFAVKRIAGLPQERIAIRAGDLFENEQIVQKPLRELRQVGSLLHDNDFLPKSLKGRQRWLPMDNDTSGWEPIPGGFRFTSPADKEQDQSLVYEHWHCSASPAPRTEPRTILDNDSYNQAKTRGLNPVPDLRFRCSVQGKTGDFIVTWLYGSQKLILHLQLDSQRFLMLKNGSTLVAGSIPHAAGEFAVETAVCDGVFLFAHNRHVLGQLAYGEMPVSGDKPTRFGDPPRIQIGAYGGPLTITHLQVWRDIYYLTPTSLGGEWRADKPLAAGHFFLLGDNPPISIDSRQWGEGVARQEIVGRVIPLQKKSGEPEA